MNVSKEELLSSLEKYNLSPKKKFGQNFLVSNKYIKRIVDELELVEGDEVIEIGSGAGSLTREILSHNVKVTAIEIDEEFAHYLTGEVSDSNLTVIGEDFLKMDLSIFVGRNIKMISNLPYYITTDIIERALLCNLTISRFVFMTQKEVEERLSSIQGSRLFRPFNYLLSSRGNLQRKFVVSGDCFFPIPHVDSLIFTYDFNGTIFESKLYEFIKKLFTNKRKTILNNLLPLVTSKDRAIGILSQVGIDSNRRPQELTMAEFKQLFEVYKN